MNVALRLLPYGLGMEECWVGVYMKRCFATGTDEGG